MIDYRPADWLGIIGRVSGTVLPRIAGRVLAVAGITLVAVLIKDFTPLDPSVPGIAHAMVGVALGLLLVFRTNASYGRYWEGRILLGGLVNNCRDLARLVNAYLPESSKESRARLSENIVAYAAVTTASLRGDSAAQAASHHVSDERWKDLESLAAPPLRVAGWMGRTLKLEADEGNLTEVRLRTLDTAISDLIDLWGRCELIVTTPVPFAYAHHIKMFLTIFCFTAPLTLITDMGWYAPMAGAVVAFGLYGIDEIGVEIEDPFGHDDNDLPMEEIVEMIRLSVNEALGEGRLRPIPQMAPALSAPAKRNGWRLRRSSP